MNEGCPEKLDWPFIAWVWNFPKRSRSKVIAALEGCKTEKEVIVLNGRKEVQKFIGKIAR
ncbi:topology modulation protein [compost metagenome]